MNCASLHNIFFSTIMGTYAGVESWLSLCLRDGCFGKRWENDGKEEKKKKEKLKVQNASPYTRRRHDNKKEKK